MGLEKPLLALAWIDLPDSLETLGNLAVQLQRLISEAVSHPILAVVIVILSIGLIQLVADLVKRTIQASLKFILTLPLTLSQRLWKQLTLNPDTKQTQINQLLERLEVLRQEQDQVIAELKPLLSPGPTSVPVVSAKESLGPLKETDSSQLPTSPTS
ncbi:hypothetical protein S7335_1770 [Synechococcus sp. PCC 7335]|uniref:hypothetical protein n=1 Tax=Synechococcus sp. (strain ATCC 29403 / PCC 7335) TaxID=91464 RepID=UPI00017EC76D|nr:hypothetical protein [Synechococcus sp. PCC 7335]EDX84073.1 hypothetical protein S7335_1770 [Synechococcus sp. PCC 7335]